MDSFARKLMSTGQCLAYFLAQKPFMNHTAPLGGERSLELGHSEQTIT